MEKYVGEIICIILCIAISSFILCVEFHVACMHIKFCWCCLHHMKGRTGLVYSTVGWLLDWNSLITHTTQSFECFQSPVSLSAIQAAENIVGLNAMRANGRLWILTSYCPMVCGNLGAHNSFLCRRTTGRTAQGDTGWTPVQQCASSGGSTVQSICARGYVSVSCTTSSDWHKRCDYNIFFI